jgi:hypothetical protein
MLAASLVTFLGIVVHQMEDLLMLLARLATNVENQAICKNTSLTDFVASLLTWQAPATAPRRLPMVISLAILSILVLPQLPQSLLSHRSLWGRHCLIGLGELSINKVELVIDFLTCTWK